MTFVRKLFGIEQRAIVVSGSHPSSDGFLSLFGFSGTKSGANVTALTSLQVPPIS